MYLIQPKTELARQWIDENVYSEPWQWLGDNLAIDHHFVENIVEGMREAGLTLYDVEVVHA